MMGWVIAGCVVIVTLAAYAAYLHWRLYEQNKSQPRLSSKQASVVEQVDPKANSHRVGLHKSLYLLADATLDDKMTHTEACLRICSVAMHLDDPGTFRREYGVLFKVAEATAHFPILDDWKALAKEEQKRITAERETIERKYSESVSEAMQRLRQQFG
jgi:hypothetical protein